MYNLKIKISQTFEISDILDSKIHIIFSFFLQVHRKSMKNLDKQRALRVLHVNRWSPRVLHCVEQEEGVRIARLGIPGQTPVHPLLEEFSCFIQF